MNPIIQYKMKQFIVPLLHCIIITLMLIAMSMMFLLYKDADTTNALKAYVSWNFTLNPW